MSAVLGSPLPAFLQCEDQTRVRTGGDHEYRTPTATGVTSPHFTSFHLLDRFSFRCTASVAPPSDTSPDRVGPKPTLALVSLVSLTKNPRISR